MNEMKVSISTKWNKAKHATGIDIIDEIKELGFSCIELGADSTKAQVEEIMKATDECKIEVPSVHNICPVAEKDGKRLVDIADRIASLNEEERKLAVAYTKNTIEIAKRINAKVVVLHLGQVDLPMIYQLILSQMVKDGITESNSFSMVRTYLKEERKKYAKLHFEAIQRSIEELIPSLSEGMKLGLENRYWYHEIPSLEETGILLEKYGDHVGYWHDTGHAHVLECYGLYNKGEFIHTYGERLIGVHLHDAINAGDHMGVGTGDIDFSELCPYLRDDVIRVFEYNPEVTAEEVVYGKVKMKQLDIIQ